MPTRRDAPTRPELVGDFGMVASTHWIASAVGMGVLERGGNAADAAVAAGFALQVVEPHLNGPGGEVPILLWDPAASAARVVCGQGVAPAAATVEAMRTRGVEVIPGTGLLAAVVPGAFGAWLALLAGWGTWGLADVLEPAIALAERGHPLLPTAAATINASATRFRSDWPTSADLWLVGGRRRVAGERVANPALAATYRRVVYEAETAGWDREAQLEAARRCWYEGFVAESIDRFSAAHGGLLTGADLACWAVGVEEPVVGSYADRWQVCKTGPWGQGPVLLQQLALLEAAGLVDCEPGSAGWIHLITECAKLAFADRDAWYGDPTVADVPLTTLLSSTYAAGRARLISGEASTELRPGCPDGRPPKLPPYWIEVVDGWPVGGGEPTLGSPQGDTCHLDVVDGNGMMISATPSGGWLQSSPAIADLGFCLGTRAQMFALAPGLPNTLRPGARPRTTLSPSLALRDGEPWMAFGTPGGDCQDQWTLQFLLNLLHGGVGDQNLQRAIDAPTFDTAALIDSFHPHGFRPACLRLEGRHHPAVRAQLAERGHRLEVTGDWSLGRVSAVAREDGWLKAGANARGDQGYAVGR
ncbi:MAG: gamma-glutamyltransferase [Microlunatus sp.]|nr:gamma-glutamyltransferase [Microlunatus sp.]MDN5804250.1 gamma-glutamyltransferase [Microlunatus sp.]